jgi:very-short-patch-repair endonuclease
MESRLLKFAKTMRHTPTDAEKTLWRELRARRFDDFKFKRQQPLGSYIVDFICFERRLIVEIDGGQHNEPVDAERTNWLEQQGFRVARYWNNDVLNNLEGVLSDLSGCLCNPPPLPNPSPARGEGLKHGSVSEISTSPLAGEVDARSAAGEGAVAQATVRSRE